MSYVVRDLGRRPGRRVLLVISEGADTGSRTAGREVRRLAQTEGVAVFGLVPPNALVWGREDPFKIICEMSGGIVQGENGVFRKEQMAHFVRMLRERYIVDFGRARNETDGEHNIEVTVAKSHFYVRPAGVSVSLPDPAMRNDPAAIRGENPDAPEFGTRKILQPK